MNSIIVCWVFIHLIMHISCDGKGLATWQPNPECCGCKKWHLQCLWTQHGSSPPTIESDAGGAFPAACIVFTLKPNSSFYFYLVSPVAFQITFKDLIKKSFSVLFLDLQGPWHLRWQTMVRSAVVRVLLRVGDFAKVASQRFLPRGPEDPSPLPNTLFTPHPAPCHKTAKTHFFQPPLLNIARGTTDPEARDKS